MEKQRIALGRGYVDRWTLLERKELFSVYVHRWATIEQDRYHTHAFSSIAILLCGEYFEAVLLDGEVFLNRVGPGIRKIPASYNHKILYSQPGTWSIVFAGAWRSWWSEETAQWKRWLGHGRERLAGVWFANL